MCKTIFTLILLALAAYGQQQKRIAIINTVDDEEPPVKSSELNYLTDRLRDIANKTLPSKNYAVMTQQSMIAFLGSQESMVKKCKESEGCLAKLGREINADYIGQGRIGRFGVDLTIKVELYESKSGTLVNSFTGTSKDIYGLLSVLDEKAPDLFKRMPGISSGAIASLTIPGGIGGVQTAGGDYEFDGIKSYLVNVVTEPEGAILSFDGVPNSHCAKTPCKVALAEGNIRIAAALEQHETADTTISIKQNNQSVNIKLKSNFGILEIKPAYLEGIGKNEQWNLTINGEASSSLENRLSPNKYKAELSHKCYESLSFDVGINKGGREIFDMAAHIKLKKGGLVLNAESNGELVSEPVFVNGIRTGETPFSGSVPICAKIELGENKESVNIELKHNEKVTHTAKSGAGKSGSNIFTDSRDGKRYKTIEMPGGKIWFAENLDYKTDKGMCYENDEAICQRCGQLYSWRTAKEVCPKGWHLPTDAEWSNFDYNTLFEFDCGYRDADGFFYGANVVGYWWSATEYDAANALSRSLLTGGSHSYNDKINMFSVRCVKDYQEPQKIPTAATSEKTHSKVVNTSDTASSKKKSSEMFGIGIGYQRIWDTHNIRFSYQYLYYTGGFNLDEQNRISEAIAGVLHRWIWSEPITYGFGLFGGLGLRNTIYDCSVYDCDSSANDEEEYINYRHELGAEFILGYFSLYIAERNFHKIGGGVGLIF